MQTNLRFSQLAGGEMRSWPISVTTASTQAIAANTRGGLLFHNPGTVDVFVCQAKTAAGVTQAAVAAAAGMIKIMAGTEWGTDNPGSGAWNCIAASTAVLTVLEW